MIPRTVLLATCAFDVTLSAAAAASAIARGLAVGGWPTDLFPVPAKGEEDPRELLDRLGFDPRMRACRAVVLGERRLHEKTLAGSVAFEIATRARQSGVPAYAVTAANGLDAFDARILDLQAILEASTASGLLKAGRELAALI